jgi:hypothetical protein
MRHRARGRREAEEAEGRHRLAAAAVGRLRPPAVPGEVCRLTLTRRKVPTSAPVSSLAEKGAPIRLLHDQCA